MAIAPNMIFISRRLLGADRGPMDAGSGTCRHSRPRQSGRRGRGVVCASPRQHHHQLLCAGGCGVTSLASLRDEGLSCWYAARNRDRRPPLTELVASDLAAIYPKPTPRVIAKARPEIDAHARKFIAMSPFCVLATSGCRRQRRRLAARRQSRALSASPDRTGC